MAANNPVAIIGAGVAGITAAIKLCQASLPVVILEGRDRIGGRVFTQRVPGCDAPIELGAEFIHGKPAEIWKPLHESGQNIIEVDGENLCVSQSELKPCEFFSEVDDILEKMNDSGPDESFLEFLNRCFPDQALTPSQKEAKQHAIRYVSGFNAADPALVGLHWLVQETRAEQEIEGDRAFRAENGYETLLETFRRQLKKLDIEVHTETVVEKIDWRDEHPQVGTRNSTGTSTLSASCVLVTIPLGVLKARPGELGTIEFNPPLPPEKLMALDKVEMGEVVRVVLQFRERFWETIRSSGGKTLSEMSFLLTEDEWFPTWWTTMPEKYPIVTGWAPFLSGRRLSGQDPSFVTRKALESLAKALGLDRDAIEAQLVGSHFHDWQSDPFSRGAYSYGKVGAVAAQTAIAAPLQNRLFFAGEATDTRGNNGTVHGAIASGNRAAEEILKALPSQTLR